MKDSNATYSVKVKSGAGWRHYDTARLQISVGQDYHEGEKFAATIAWAGANFKKVIVCVNDTLQRFNVRFETGAPEQIAETISRNAGESWLNRNRDVIGSLPDFEIYRWDEWRHSQDFAKQLADVQNLYDTQSDVRAIFDADIANFWQRRADRLGVIEDFRKPAFEKLSTQYLIEETAAFFLMFKKARATDVYPGSVLLPCALNQNYGPDAGNADQLGTRGFTRIDFSRKDPIRKTG